MTEKPNAAQQMRDYLQANGPQTTQQLMAAFGMKFAQVWGTCRPQVRYGTLLFDAETGCYSFARNRKARAKQTPEQRRAAVLRYEAKRLEQRKALRKASKPVLSPEEREASRLRRQEAERARLALRNEQRRAARAAEGRSRIRLVQNKEVRKRDHDQCTAEHVGAAQAMRNKEHGVRDRSANAPLPCSSAFIDANPHLHHVLANGVVSQASQFQRLRVSA